MREWIMKAAFSAYEFLLPVYGAAFVALILVLLPMAAFRRTRGYAAIGMLVVSYLFGAVAWLYSAGVTFALFSWVGLIVGLLVAGVGVVPMAFFGALFKGHGPLAWGVALAVILSLGTRVV